MTLVADAVARGNGRDQLEAIRPGGAGQASLVLGEEAPQDRREARAEPACDVAVEPLVARERVMKLLARDAVGDRGDCVETSRPWSHA